MEEDLTEKLEAHYKSMIDEARAGRCANCDKLKECYDAVLVASGICTVLQSAHKNGKDLVELIEKIRSESVEIARILGKTVGQEVISRLMNQKGADA